MAAHVLWRNDSAFRTRRCLRAKIGIKITPFGYWSLLYKATHHPLFKHKDQFLEIKNMKKPIIFLIAATLLSASAFAKELEIPLKKFEEYQKAKPALLKAGWKPVKFKDNQQELPEIKYCQQGGEGHCGIWLTAGKGKYLWITTTNDGYAILGWKKTKSLPKD